MAKSKYEPDFPERAEAYAKQGLKNIEIARKLGISKDTFYVYKKLHSDFSDSIKRGKAPVDFEVEQSLLKSAKGFEFEETTVEYIPVKKGKNPVVKSVKKVKKFIPPNIKSIKYWLGNRKPEKWRDRRDFEHTVNVALSMAKLLKSTAAFKEDESRS